MFFGNFDPVHMFLTIKINNFRGDLPDVSAYKVWPILTSGSSATVEQYMHHITASFSTIETKKNGQLLFDTKYSIHSCKLFLSCLMYELHLID